MQEFLVRPENETDIERYRRLGIIYGIFIKHAKNALQLSDQRPALEPVRPELADMQTSPLNCVSLIEERRRPIAHSALINFITSRTISSGFKPIIDIIFSPVASHTSLVQLRFNQLFESFEFLTLRLLDTPLGNLSVLDKK